MLVILIIIVKKKKTDFTIAFTGKGDKHTNICSSSPPLLGGTQHAVSGYTDGHTESGRNGNAVYERGSAFSGDNVKTFF